MPAKICVSIGRGRHRMMIAETQHLAESGVELVELRLDYIRRAVNIKRLLETKPCDFIVTCRRPADGGKWRGTEQDRVVLLRTAIAEGVDYVDLEMDVASQIPRYGKTKRIISYHNFQQTPDDLEQIYKRMEDYDPDIIKVATMAHSPHDNFRVLQLGRNSKVPTVAFCMGEMGTPSRVLCGKFGAPFSYATFSSERRLAPGMLSYQEMQGLYRFETINEQTQIFGVIADPVEHSLSPLVHNQAMQRLKLDMVYLPFRVPREHLEQFMKDAPTLGIEGISVTIPHKETVLKSLTDLDDDVSGILAANTVLFKPEGISGHNTDCRAAMKCLLRALEKDPGTKKPLTGVRFLLLGTGGVARAIGYGIQKLGGTISIAGRNVHQTEELALRMEGKAVNWMARHGVETDVLINCTPVGMHPNLNESPFEERYLNTKMLVFDTVYNPEQTLLIKHARERGCQIITGVEMFVRQAVLQFELFTNTKVDKNTVHADVKRAISAARL